MTRRFETQRRGIPATAVALGLVAGLSTYGVATLLNRRLGRPPDSASPRTKRGLNKFGDFTVVGRTVLIQRPRKELYTFWRRFENLAKFMENIENVRSKGDNRHVWTIKAPAGTELNVETEITEDRPGEHISWASVKNSDITTKGRVAFRDAPDGRGTYVEAIIA